MFNNLRSFLISKKNISIISSFFILVIITSTFINYNHSSFGIKNFDSKIKYSEYLSDKETYKNYFDRDCVVSSSNEE